MRFVRLVWGFVSGLTLLCLFGSGCGNNSTPSPQFQPLNPEEKRELTAVADSVARSRLAAEAAAGVEPDGSKRPISSPVSGDDSLEIMAGLLRKNCEFEVEAKKNQGGYNKLTVKGPRCPIQFSINNKTSETGFSMQWQYEVIDQAYRALNDVDKFSLAQSAKVSSRKESSRMNNQLRITGNGSFHSQKKGNATIEVEGSLDSVWDTSGGQIKSSTLGETKTTLRIGLQTAQFSALTKVIDNEDRSEYLLNGEKITYEEYERFCGSAIR